MLESGSFPSAVMYKFGVSTSRTMTMCAMQSLQMTVGAGERADAAAGDGGAEVDDGDRVVWDSRIRGTTPAAAGAIAENWRDRPSRRCALTLASRTSALL